MATHDLTPVHASAHLDEALGLAPFRRRATLGGGWDIANVVLVVKSLAIMALTKGNAPRRSTPRIALLAIGLGTFAGCGGGALQSASISVWGTDLAPVGPPGYNISLAVTGDSACQSTPPPPSFTMTLNDAPLAYQDCIASASGFLSDGTFTFRLRDGSDSAEVVLADLFPGLQATVSNPAGGQVAPGATFDVTIPPALQFETPLFFGAAFTYLDMDDPSYLGDATNPKDEGTVIHVVAPQHAGHFTLWIAMSTPPPVTYPALWPEATVVSCSGVSSCRAFGAPDIGPLAIEVVPTAAPAN